MTFDDVNNQLIVRDYMPMKTLQVLSYMALRKLMYILGKGHSGGLMALK